MTHTKTIGELVLESQTRNTAEASLELWTKTL